MVIKLEGEWNVRLDPNLLGESDHWELGLGKGGLSVWLPTSLNEAGIGDIPTLQTEWTGSIFDRSWFHDPELKSYRDSSPPHFPFWLTPKKHYVGTAWYEREFEIPEAFVGVPFRITFERPHWQTQLWVDGEYLGACRSLCVAHLYEHSGVNAAGNHRIMLRVDNAIRDLDPGPDAHSISDHTQGNWNGVIGEMKLEFLSSVEIRNVQLDPDFESNFLHVRGLLAGMAAVRGNLSVEIAPLINEKGNENAEPITVQTCVATQSIYHEFELQLNMEGLHLWDEFDPALYQVSISFRASDGSEIHWSEPHGFRDFKADGRRLSVNGRPLFLLGNVDCCIFPLTGYPPMGIQAWKHYFQNLQRNGFNHVRFHSWCPPKAAFYAADQLGVYLQVEAPTWPNKRVSLGDGATVDHYVYEETERILEHYGNHASLCMVASGNEPFGDNQVDFLGKYVLHFKALDRRQLYTGASVGTKWPIVPESEFIVHSQPRGLPFEDQAPHACFDFSEEIEGFSAPFISHEMGQFCVFPDFDEIEHYTGVYQPKNLEMFRDRFLKNFPIEVAEKFLVASGKLQVLCYKAEIEAALRTSDLAGIQLLGANDFPGQGTALIGWLNAFYEPKRYVNFQVLKRFLAPTVVLARTSKFVYQSTETAEWILEIAHFGATDLLDQPLDWRLNACESGQLIEEGSLKISKIRTGQVSLLTMINVQLDLVKTASKCVLNVSVGDFSNEWNFWVFPDAPEVKMESNTVVIAESSNEVMDAIENEKDILILAGPELQNGRDIVQYFRPAFWNTSWFQMAPPHTLGLCIDDEHPVFCDFPTDFHSDYQWWELVQNQPVANLENFPESLTPIVRPIDTWFINRRLGMLFEFRIVESRVVCCTADLHSACSDVVSKNLFRSILSYMKGEEFEPTVEVSREAVFELFEKKKAQNS